MIYVFIACRLDNEIIPTCYDLIQKADNPSDIKVIVFNQDRKEDMFFQSLFPEQVTLINIDYKKISNICWIRSLANFFIEPRFKYYLSIDSHMRFDKGWDAQLINTLKPNSVLSAYPPEYQLYGSFEKSKSHHTNGFNLSNNGQFPFVINQPDGIEEDYKKSTIAAGFHFTTIDWLEKVGYDKLLCWRFEEIDLTYRTIAAGYDIINYKQTPIYHLYDRRARKQEDHGEIYLMDCNERIKTKFNKEDTDKINLYYNINFDDFIKNYL
jgi:hypothetical protein